MINSSYFASAWFITIFTNCIKHAKPDQNEQVVVSEQILQLWDYFLVAGWKAILKMGLYVLKDSSEDLLSRSFEDILNDITEKPKLILCTEYQRERTASKGDSSPLIGSPMLDNQILYQKLRSQFRSANGNQGSLLEFHLNRLKQEFEESHSAAKLQPKQNKSFSKAFRKTNSSKTN